MTCYQVSNKNIGVIASFSLALVHMNKVKTERSDIYSQSEIREVRRLKIYVYKYNQNEEFCHEHFWTVTFRGTHRIGLKLCQQIKGPSKRFSKR